MSPQAAPLRDPPGPLASSLQVPPQPVFDVPVDLPHGRSTVPFTVIGLPTPQLQVEAADQFGNRDVLLPVRDQFSHARDLALFRLLAWRNSPVPMLWSVRR